MSLSLARTVPLLLADILPSDWSKLVTWAKSDPVIGPPASSANLSNCLGTHD